MVGHFSYIFLGLLFTDVPDFFRYSTGFQMKTKLPVG
jgi:hypothetical protein